MTLPRKETKPTTPAPRRMSDEEIEKAKQVASRMSAEVSTDEAISYIRKLLSHIASLDAERAVVAGEAASILRRLDESGSFVNAGNF